MKKALTIENKQAMQFMINWLVDHFPLAFFNQAHHVKPLEIGIFDHIIEFCECLDFMPFSRRALREALNFYSSSRAYLSCQKMNIARVNLYGNPVDWVTEKQAAYAKECYQQRYHNKKTNA